MKNILLISLFFSVWACTKTSWQEIPSSKSQTVQVVGIESDSAHYSEIIDVMVAFLWPLKIETPEQQVSLERVIADSRELVSSKKRYLNKKFELQDLFLANLCPCALNQECSGNETGMDQNKCYEIEDAIYENDRSLIAIFGLVENIKKNVIEIGGEWLDTHLDLKEIPSPTVKFGSMDIHFTALGSYLENNTTKPFSYFIKSARITQETYYKRMTFTVPRLFFEDGALVTHGDWIVDVGLSENKASLLFQGDLFWNYQGQKRRGVIYWENPKAFK